MYIKINDTVFTINEEESYTILELLRNVIIPKVEENAENITTLQDAVIQIESELGGIQTQLVSITTDLDTAKLNITELKTDVNHIITVDIIDINNEITSIKSVDSRQDTTLGQFAAEITQIKSKNVEQDTKIEDITNKTNQNSQNISSLGVQYNALNDSKYDNATITNENTLNFFANNVLKKSVTLPTSGGGASTNIEHIQLLTDNNEPVNAIMIKTDDYAIIFMCDINNFSNTDHLTLPQNLQSNFFISTGNYTNGEGKVMQAGNFKDIYIVVDNNNRSNIKIMGQGAMPVVIGTNSFIWAWFVLKLTEG